MQKYDPKKNEAKWQKYWEKNKLFEVKEDARLRQGSGEARKFYGLIEFPYPSAAGLHVGHPRSYTAMDVICRKRRMEGYNVLFPIGFDAFGLPTENFAIKTGRQPAEVTKENIANFTRQLKSLGFSFDWSRVVDTTDPAYYKWTQWIFLQFFKHNLAYKKKQPINWCPKDKIGLANEEVVDGRCERCGGPVEKRDKEQWMLAITKYADSLLKGLDEVDYIEQAKTQQRNWIGRSEYVEKRAGKIKVSYKLHDWVFSRQRYWGEPIPLVHCENCGGWIPIPEKELPLELPKVEKYQPTDTGESPLAAISDWVNTKCPKCGGKARRETDTMPNWAGSSWYFLRYCDPHNDKEFASMEKLKYWLGSPEQAIGGVDWYNGGMEHTVLHLLYSRFWNQFLFDIGVAPTREPYAKRTSHGMILAKGGEKMSKSKGNVVNPDEMVEQFGADALRVYILFMGPFDQAVEWDTNGLIGVRRFLDRVWNLKEKVINMRFSQNPKVQKTADSSLLSVVHFTIKKVTEDIEAMRFNTAIAKLMELTNEMMKEDKISSNIYLVLLKLISPFAPHIAEELWNKLGHKKSIAFEPWPEYEPSKIIEDTVTIAVQINGKLRATFEAAVGEDEEMIKEKAFALENVKKWLENKTPKKVIYIKDKLVSVVV